MDCCLLLEVEVGREKLWETGSKYSGFMGKEPVSSVLTYPKNQNYLMNQFGAHLTKEPVLCPLTGRISFVHLPEEPVMYN